METRQQRKDRLETEVAQQKTQRENYVKLLRRIRSDLNESGLTVVKYKRDYVSSSGVGMPDLGMDNSEVLRCYTEAIDGYIKKQKS